VFGFASPDKADTRAADEMPMQAQAAPIGAAIDRARQVAPAALATTGPRRIDVSVPAAAMAANDTGTQNGSTTIRETKVYATSSGGAQMGAGTPSGSRTRGIGNRFRSVSSAGATQKPETR